MKKHLLTALALLSVSFTALASPCATDSATAYATEGFTCDVGDLHFSNFFYNGTFFGSNQFRTGSFPADVVITPVATSGGGGFTLSNMNLSFTGGMSSTSAWLVFDVLAMAGLITDASVALGSNHFTGDGYVQAGFSDYNSAIFGAGAYRSTAWGDVLSSSTSFAGVTGFQAFSSATAGNGSFRGGDGFIDGYTVLLSTTQGPGTVPEPASALLVLGGLLALSTRRTGNRSWRPQPSA